VVLVTHAMKEAERLCDRVAVMDAGRIVTLDTPSGLIARHTLVELGELLTRRGDDDDTWRTAGTSRTSRTRRGSPSD
jgi:ABC-2 type transport system ATP-binding protein